MPFLMCCVSIASGKSCLRESRWTNFREPETCGEVLLATAESAVAKFGTSTKAETVTRREPISLTGDRDKKMF